MSAQTLDPVLDKMVRDVRDALRSCRRAPLVSLTIVTTVGLGLGLYTRTVPSTYADLVNESGGEIEQRLKLRTVPFNASFRLLPFGREAITFGVNHVEQSLFVGRHRGTRTWTWTLASNLRPRIEGDGSVRFAGSALRILPVAIRSSRAFFGCEDAKRKTPMHLAGTSTFTARRKND